MSRSPSRPTSVQRGRRREYFDAKSRLSATLQEVRGEIKRETAKFPLSGISLNFLQEYFPFERYGSMEELERNVIEMTREDQCSFVELLASSEEKEFRAAVKPKAHFFVSFAYRTKWADLLSALLNYQRQNGLADMYIWMSVFSVNQHEANHFEKKWFREAFSKAIREIGHTLFIMSPWPESIALQRLWCIFELYITLSHESCKLDVVLSEDDELELIDKLKQDKEASCYTTVESQKARASRPEDEKELRKYIMALSFEAVNSAISSRLDEWISTTFNSAVLRAREKEEHGAKDRALMKSLYLDERMSKYLVDTGKPRLAEERMRRSLARCLKLHGEVHPSTALAHDAIAYVFQKEGDHTRAYEQLEKAGKIKLECCEKQQLEQGEIPRPLHMHVKLLLDQMKPSQAQDLIEFYSTSLVDPAEQDEQYTLLVQSVHVLFLHETSQEEKVPEKMQKCEALAKVVSTRGDSKVPYEYALCLARQAELEEQRSLPKRVEQSLRMSIRFSRPHNCPAELAERLYHYAEILMANEKFDDAKDAFDEAEAWNATLEESERRLSLHKLLAFKSRLVRRSKRQIPVARAAPGETRRPRSVRPQSRGFTRPVRIAIRSKKGQKNRRMSNISL